MEPVIQVDNIGKKYIIGHSGRENLATLRETLTDALNRAGRRLVHPLSPHRGQAETEEFWALRNIHFDIQSGERVGIIGRNGAGKSTLLKILSRVTEPTEGRVRIKGRVSSLLEVGTGFHQELTGRENIFLNGAILGMSRTEIRKKFDEIVAFSEIDKFLDTPVKRYSSGMFVRLAFGVAAHLDPEILIVDEVLAVGDAQFQKKCIGKMGEVSHEGKTILFVSHNMGTVKSLCTRGILLSRGGILKQGPMDEVVDSYMQSAGQYSDQAGMVCWEDRRTAPGGEEVRLVSIRLLDEAEEVRGTFDAEKPVKIEIRYEVFERVRGMRIVLQVLNSEGIVAFSSTDHAERDIEAGPGLYSTTCLIPGCILNAGLYYAKIHAGCPSVKVLVQGEEFLKFWVEKGVHHGSFFPEKWPGVVAPRLTWETQKIDGARV